MSSAFFCITKNAPAARIITAPATYRIVVPIPPVLGSSEPGKFLIFVVAVPFSRLVVNTLFSPVMLSPFSSEISNLVNLGAFKGSSLFTASYVPSTSNTKSSALL